MGLGRGFASHTSRDLIGVPHPWDVHITNAPARAPRVSVEVVMRQLIVLFLRLWRLIEPQTKRRFATLLPLMFLASLAEMVSIGAVAPFLVAVSDPLQVLRTPFVGDYLTSAGLTAPNEIIVAITAALAVLIAAAVVIRLIFLRASIKAAFESGRDLSVAVFRAAITKPFPDYARANSSDLIAVLTNVHAIVFEVLQPAALAFGSLVIASFILATLLIVDWFVALIAFATVAAIYGAVIWSLRALQSSNARVLAENQAKRVRLVQESLGGIRDIILDQSHDVVAGGFNANEKVLRDAQASVSFFTSSPRLLVEGLSLISLMGLGLWIGVRAGSMLGALPVIGALALGAQRLLPLVQQIYISISRFMASRHVMEQLLHLAQAARTPPARADTAPLPFTRVIRADGVSFQYAGDRAVILSDLNFEIPLGSRVAIVGPSGSGKSTLMDLILGLLAPSAGRIWIDDTELSGAAIPRWQRHIGHVPQSIFLSDSTILQNIAFGVPRAEIDHARVAACARQAGLDGYVAGLANGYETVVGERGGRLSGGQRQRLGIARALYKRADVLVLDEATSALDEDTEQQVLTSLLRLDRSITLIIITHKLALAAACDVVLHLRDGGLTVASAKARPAAATPEL
jgi:ATP-binding cassette, subfamily B, bacterial PglK